MKRFTRRGFIKGTAVLTGLPNSSMYSGRRAAADSPPVPADALGQLRAKLKGRLVVPGDSLYEGARKVFYWNPKTERKPAAVVQCGHEEDAVRAVEFARQQGLEVAVRSGGHSHLAWGSSDGLVIDLSQLKQTTIE